MEEGGRGERMTVVSGSITQPPPLPSTACEPGPNPDVAHHPDMHELPLFAALPRLLTIWHNTSATTSYESIRVILLRQLPRFFRPRRRLAFSLAASAAAASASRSCCCRTASAVVSSSSSQRLAYCTLCLAKRLSLGTADASSATKRAMAAMPASVVPGLIGQHMSYLLLNRVPCLTHPDATASSDILFRTVMHSSLSMIH